MLEDILKFYFYDMENGYDSKAIATGGESFSGDGGKVCEECLSKVLSGALKMLTPLPLYKINDFGAVKGFVFANYQFFNEVFEQIEGMPEENVLDLVFKSFHSV